MKIRDILKKFVVLEGLDGSGTTTQLKMLKQKLDKEKIASFLTMEPTDGVIGRVIRDALRKKNVLDNKTLAFLFAADRNDHLYGKDGIIEQLKQGKWVICDRYFFSSIAYQSLSCKRNWVIEINDFPLPEYLFFIATSPQECQKRMENRAGKELFEDIKLQKDILDNYNYGINKYKKSGMKAFYINGEESPEIINEKIWEILSQCR
ncbi:MAG: dTMP kinase [Spirochaetes bacterium]|nr:dTMP kinase [Spirochaetota bacterium]